MLNIRFLARRKLLATIAVLTMALAVAATTAALSVLKAFLLSSLGVPNADRIVAIQPERSIPGRGYVQFADAYPNYELLRQTQHSFNDVAVIIQLSASWDDHGDARQLSATRASASFMPTFGARPILGRAFTEREEGPSPATVVMISYGLWASSFASDPNIIGKTLSLNGAPHTVIGVMPRGFTQPGSTDIWLPFDIPANQRTLISGARQLNIFGRLQDGTTLDAARRDVAAFTARTVEANPADNKDYRYAITTLRDNLLSGADSSALFVLAGAAGLLSLAVLNLASLLLAWGFERRQEFAVRIALGAGGRQVARLMLQQSLIIVAAGTIVGIGFSYLALYFLRGFDLGPTVTPFVATARLDFSVLAVATLAAILAGAAAGALPIWFTRDREIGDTLRSSSRSSTLSRGAMAWQKAMVFGQAALSVVILVAAVLVGVSFWHLSEVPGGFATRNRVVARLILPDATYGRNPARVAFGSALADNLAAQPDLVSSGFTTTLPVGDGAWGGRFFVELPDHSLSSEPVLFHFRRVSPSYIGAMGIPLLRGRGFTAQDDSIAIPVAIVSRALADRLWPHEDAVGKHLYRAAAASNVKPTMVTVVGLVGNTMDAGYGSPAGEAIYVPYSQVSAPRISIVAEGRGNTAQTVAAIKRALKAADPVIAAGNIATLDALVLQANALPRLRTLVLLVFAIVAVGIVALGSYGVMSQLVSTREREFAVRLVFGAHPNGLGRMVLLQVARITLPGIGIGLVAMWLGSGALKTFVFGVQPASAAVLATSGAVLLGLSVLAALPCALRAMRVDIHRGVGAA
jgi:putative ABC transport system permease protein